MAPVDGEDCPREDKAATKQVTFAVCKSIDFESWLFLTEKPFSRPVRRTVFCELGALLLLAHVFNSESQVELSQVELRVQKQKVILQLFWSSRHSALGGVPPLEVRYWSQGRRILLFSHRPPSCSLLSIIAQSQLQGLGLNILLPMVSYGRGQEMGILK